MTTLDTTGRAVSPSKQFYRRPLPSTCVDFGSKEGKCLFLEALNEGTMNIYFKLAPQFQTQEDPAFCGLSTLVMTLNALEVDPGRIWKGPWRWYHESMLDCCKPLEKIRLTGINFEQFVCLARCNRLLVEKAYASTGDEKSIDKFRASVLKSVRSDNDVLILSYNRSTLQQTGSGHFSPVGGYHAASDKLLILDVARFKYPPHWVDLKLCFQAMQNFDPETNRPRGYMLLKMAPKTTSLLLLQLVSSYSDLSSIYSCWNKFLASPDDFSGLNDERDPQDSQFINSVLKLWAQRCLYRAVDLRDGLELTPEGGLCCHCKMSVEHLNVVEYDILNELTALPEYHYLKNELNMEAKKALLIVSLFLSWPFEMFTGSKLTDRLASYCSAKLSEMSDLARNEIAQLKTQLFVIMNEFALGNGCFCTAKPSGDSDGL